MFPSHWWITKYQSGSLLPSEIFMPNLPGANCIPASILTASFIRIQSTACFTFSTSFPCKCSHTPVSNLGNRPNPSMKTIRNVWFGETNWYLPPQESCNKLLAPCVRRSWMTLVSNHPVFGEHCMKRLDSCCWIVTADGVAAAVVVVFVVYQGQKHLGPLDPSFESPRLWSNGSTWAPNSFSNFSWSWNSWWYRRSKVGAFMNHYIARWKLWWKNLPNVEWMVETLLPYCTCIMYICHINTSFHSKQTILWANQLSYHNYSAFCIFHVYQFPIDLDPPMQRVSRCLTHWAWKIRPSIASLV